MFEKLAQLHIDLPEEKKEVFSNFIDIFIRYNAKVNLMSRNDTNILFEKHIYDSLAFNLFYTKYNFKNPLTVMDMGTGGGFPSIPLAIYYDNFKITAVDSINKKIKFINYAVKELGIKNIEPICSRVEKFPNNSYFDIIVTRAMADLGTIIEYAIPHLKENGYFIAYKSKKADEEIEKARNIFKRFDVKSVDKIEYSLPLKEENKRVLLVIKKN